MSGSDKNCLKYLLSAGIVGSSGVPVLSTKYPFVFSACMFKKLEYILFRKLYHLRLQ